MKSRINCIKLCFSQSTWQHLQMGGISAQQWHGIFSLIRHGVSFTESFPDTDWGMNESMSLADIEEDTFGHLGSFSRFSKRYMNISDSLGRYISRSTLMSAFSTQKGAFGEVNSIVPAMAELYKSKGMESKIKGIEHEKIRKVLAKSHLLETAGLDCGLMKFILTSVLSLGWDQVWILWRSWEWLLWTLPDPWWSTTTATDNESEGCDMLETFLGQESKAMVK